MDKSTWNVEETSTIEPVENITNPYSKRKVGKTHRVQVAEEEEVSNQCEWMKNKCPLCNKGFKRSPMLLNVIHVTLLHIKSLYVLNKMPAKFGSHKSRQHY